MSKKSEKKYSSLKNFFGGVKKQKRTEKTNTADGMELKKMIETHIHFASSANFEAKEN